MSKAKHPVSNFSSRAEDWDWRQVAVAGRSGLPPRGQETPANQAAAGGSEVISAPDGNHRRIVHVAWLALRRPDRGTVAARF